MEDQPKLEANLQGADLQGANLWQSTFGKPICKEPTSGKPTSSKPTSREPISKEPKGSLMNSLSRRSETRTPNYRKTFTRQHLGLKA
jgi:hypothetical protein